MISKVYDVIKGEVAKPDDAMHPRMPITPNSLTEQTTSMEAEKLACFWTQFNIQMNYYNTQLEITTAACLPGRTGIPKLWESSTKPWI